MNFLFHMALSGDDGQVLTGNFMGDFVKGPLDDRFPPRIRAGLYLHRRIDSFADRHPVYRRSRQRLAGQYGLYRGVMLDLFYDHLLVSSWPEWCSEPLEEYLHRTRAVIMGQMEHIPPERHRLIPVILDELIPSYASVTGIGSALARISQRLSRPNPLAGSEMELTRCSQGLQEDYAELTPDLFRFAAAVRAEPAPASHYPGR